MEAILNLIGSNLGTITGFILGIGIVVPFVLKFKGIVKDLIVVLQTIDNALSDNKVTVEEIQEIVDTAKHAFADLLSKK